MSEYLFQELYDKVLFSVDDVRVYYEKPEAARSAIRRFMRGGMVARIRNNLYTCIDPDTGRPVAHPEQIACAITPTAYISHHIALKYHGLVEEDFKDIFVLSESSFRRFEFDGYTYHYMHSKVQAGIESIDQGATLRVADVERAVLDMLRDMDKTIGIHQTLDIIDSVKEIDMDKILDYLEVYDSAFLYQKALFVLKRRVHLLWKTRFFKTCKKKIGQSSRYLTGKVKGEYDYTSRLVIPEEFFGRY